MSRRVSLPGADELFRASRSGRGDDAGEEVPSGRERHDEKITVYCSSAELIGLEHTRLTLRREHGLAVDRGRIVREAIHLAIEGVERDGAESVLVQRLREP